MKKILAISSSGGHWTQMQRITSSFSGNEVVYVSTLKGYVKEVSTCKYYQVKDASAWNKLNLIVLFFQLIKIIMNERPDIVISTGAAPGLFAIIISRFVGAKTIWLDSIANYEQISLSGKLAKYFTHLHLTQWEHLTNQKTQFSGKVL
ncbi:MAG: oligosaccharide biosynthesis protein Alg14 [Flavobacteriales bacterium]|jgi:UDP-N-acetylglucosamine:LPS N-acetylglucosamine transferase|nr:oligosaccharide biosynthesis protein Alg14 [Flavobacteriales bacterium]